MSDKVCSTNNKRVVLLLLSFMLLVSCCFFGTIGVKSVSADEVSYFYHVEDGFLFSYRGDCVYQNMQFFSRKYVTCSLYNGDLGVDDFSSLPIGDIVISGLECVPSQYLFDGDSSRDDFSFVISFSEPLVFHYSESAASPNSWFFFFDDDGVADSICFCLPEFFKGVVSNLGEPLDYNSCRFKAISSIEIPCYLSFCNSTYDASYASYSYGLGYSVSFLDKNGSELVSESCLYGEYASVPTAPTYEGYDFVGWLPNVSGVNVSDPITCDVTFTATYSIKQYSVTLKDYDGSIISSSIVDYGNSFNTDYVPTRIGYTFVGYSSSSGYTLGSPIYEDIVLVADYEINRYSVVFKDYDGSIISSSVVDYGSSVVAPNSPTLVGHTFEGWSCFNSSYGVGSVVDCDLIFVANYSLNTYSISFYDYDDSLLGSVVVSFGYRVNSSDIPNVSRVGYSFNGWDSSVDGFAVTDIVYCDVDFTANYSIITEFWNGYEYAKDENYNNGYDEGCLSGKDYYYSNGYSEGYSNGYGVGYTEGENSALSSKDTFKSFMYSIIDAPFNVLSNAFSFEIFGINLSYFLISIVSLLLVAVVIRKLI